MKSLDFFWKNSLSLLEKELKKYLFSEKADIASLEK